MTNDLPTLWRAGVRDGSIVPYLGPGVLADVRALDDGRPMPATSDALILAMNGGKPMSPKLMYEFPRAAMNVELKRGRAALTRFLDATYGATRWTRAAVHDWLQQLRPRYVIDINRDAQLLDSYAATPHLLVQGCARLGGSDYRYRLYVYDGSDYQGIAPAQAPRDLPVLFKPMGSPRPQASYVASDADYVDYITELMGGFAIPGFVKELRSGKRYLFIGMRFSRDTERMVARELIHGAGQPAGWALLENATDKEKRFLSQLGIAVVPMSIAELLNPPLVAA